MAKVINVGFSATNALRYGASCRDDLRPWLFPRAGHFLDCVDASVNPPAAPVTYLFSDIEGSTRLWEQEPERMRPALQRHDALCRAAVEGHRGRVVKMTGDGVHAAFENPVDALVAALELQLAMTLPAPSGGMQLRLRCGLHSGVDQRRDNDFFGPAVNRAARIMSAAHGGQMLLSRAVAERVEPALPAGVGLRDLGRVRLRDLADAEHVFQVVHPDLRQAFPPLRSLEATPNNLVQQLNSFIGRERELAEVKAMLARARLLALLGMGGIGKSRLSVQLAADVMDDYPDGVWFVELAPLTDPRSVPQALASVLGVVAEGDRPVVEALVKHVRDRQLLVVLDNCEHVVDACAELAKQLLQAGPRVKVLASSRDYLRVAGEVAYHVPTLSTPDPNEQVEIGTLAHHESVRLFVDRAVATQPSFELTAQNAAAVAEICHRLDGIPLAIELAAARTRAMSVAAIAQRLGDRFRLLVTGDKTVLPRQRTLRALIDWSYDLLPVAERTLLQRLSVFAGGWTLEAAEAVGGGDGLEAADVLDLLTQLVEKSLVVMAPGGGRYRMLDTVQHYAAEKFEESGTAEPTRSRHLAFYLAFAEASLKLVGSEKDLRLQRLDLERENLLLAIESSKSSPKSGEYGSRFIRSLGNYWITRGLLSEGLRISREVLARSDLQVRAEVRARALYRIGQLSLFAGQDSPARGYLAEALSIAREIGDQGLISEVLQPLAAACTGEHDFAAAQELLSEAIKRSQEAGNDVELMAAMNALGMLHRVMGEPDQSAPLYEKCVALSRGMGDLEHIAVNLLNLAMVSITRATPAEIAMMLQEILDIADKTGSRPVLCSAMELCSGVASSFEEWLLAAQFYGTAQALRVQTGLGRDAADEAFIAPWIEVAKQRLNAGVFMSSVASGGAAKAQDALRCARAWLHDVIES